jgi:hypothetical protein
LKGKQQLEAAIRDIIESQVKLKMNKKEALAEVRNIIQYEQKHTRLQPSFDSFFK